MSGAIKMTAGEKKIFGLIFKQIECLVGSTRTVRMPLKAAACIFLTRFFNAVYIEKRQILQAIYVLKKEILQKNPPSLVKSGFKSRAGYNGVQTVCISK
jgi:hypothetical protein